MSAYTSYVPWRNKESSSYSSTGRNRSSDRQSSTSATTTPSTLDKNGRGSYAGLSSYRPPPTTSSVRGSSSIRERASSAEGRSGGSGSTNYGKYSTRSYSDKVAETSGEQAKEKAPSLRSSRWSSTYSSPETPTLRLGSSARFGGQIARSPLSDKSPTVFGVSPSSEDKKEADKMVLATRGTSPTPPSASSYLRARRADLEAVTTKEVPRLHFKPHSTDAETQTEEQDGSTGTRSSASVSPSPPSSSRTSWSPARISNSSYTPPTSRFPSRVGYSYTRPTDLPLWSGHSKPDPEPEEPRVRPKTDAKDPSRIGGFSYTRSADLSPKSPSKKLDSDISPRSPHVTKNLSLKEAVSAENVAPSVPLRTSSIGVTENKEIRKSPSASKVKKSKSIKQLPPPVPKSEPPKILGVNKDFRKSTLNMDPAIRNAVVPSKSKTKVAKSSSKIKVSPSVPKIAQQIAKQSSLLVPKSSEEESSSEDESSESESTESSSEEESSEEISEPADKKSTNSLQVAGKSSGQLSSAEEGSVTADKPPKHPPLPRSPSKGEPSKTEEAKTVLVRALAPVTGPMKVKLPGSSTTSSSEEPSDKSSKSSSAAKQEPSNKSEPSTEQPYKHYKIRRFDSGVAWWMENSSNDVPGLAKTPSSKSVSKSPSSKSVSKSPTQKDLGGSSIKEENEKITNKPISKSSTKIDVNSNSLSIKEENDEVDGKPTEKDESSVSSSVSKEEGFKVENDAPDATDLLLQPNNFTPGMHRIFSKKAIEEQKSPYKLRKMDSEDKPWWLDGSSDNIPGIQRAESKSSVPGSLKSSSFSIPEVQENGSCHSIPEMPSEEAVPVASDLRKAESTQSLPGLQKTRSSKSVTGLQKNGSAKSIPSMKKEDNSKTDLARNARSNSLTGLDKASGTKPLVGLKKSESTSGINKKGKEVAGGLKKASSSKSIPTIEITGSSSSLQDTSREVPSTELGEKEKGTDEIELVTRDSLKVPYRVCRSTSGDMDWWLDNDEKSSGRLHKTEGQVFVGTFVNIDHVLGTIAPPPEALRTPKGSSSEDSDSDGDDCFKKIDPDQVIIHDSTPKSPIISPGRIKLDDTALQLYKDGDYGAYLDLEASIDEQQEEFDSFNTNRKNSIVLRTQLSVRVHTIIEKLHKSEGRELRRALFSLKQIFQEDKDLVHEFVQNDGLGCLIRVGTDADQNYQNYILRALGQIMLYVDGMNGVIEHPATVQWLYNLVASKFRLVVKTALKLLLVFVEYVESNCVLLVKSVRAVDYVHSCRPWSNMMKLMKEYDVADTELLIYAMTLINKTLNGLPDQDMYYDQVDALEEQGLESVIRRYMAKQGTDLDLLRQFQIYEAVLQHEDGEEKGTPLRQLDETIRKALRNRKSLSSTLNPVERRKSRRNSTGNTPLTITLTPAKHIPPEQLSPTENNLNGLTNGNSEGLSNGHSNHNGVEGGKGDGQPRREGTVKDLTQKLATTLGSPPGEEPKLPGGPFGDMKGIISKAKEGLAKSQSRAELQKTEMGLARVGEVKKTETDLQWEELVGNSSRELFLCDLDFRDLASEDERDILAPATTGSGIPPPPPPCCALPPPPAPSPHQPPPPSLLSLENTPPSKKTKKTVKLFWKEVREDPIVITKMNSGTLLWDELTPVVIDTQKLEHLFESRAKDLITKEKQQEMNKNKEIIVLDPKRSNAINIGMTKLPPPRSIKTAILKMDATVMNREGIEKLLTMLPSEEERSKIQEAQAASPDLPLGSAEQFLLTLASISELDARLKLWAFKLDYENSEKEIAEPLMDLKQGMETLRVNRTFRAILGTLLSIGIFLNGTEVKGFQIEYLSKVPEVKDTVHKHSLLHHLCFMVMEKFPDSTDLYSEIGAVTRASKVDFDELSGNINKMEQECKASFDHLKIISKHDGTTNMKLKMSDFLADCAERIIVLSKVHRRILNRFRKFILWLGIPLHRVSSIKPNELCRIVSEFALEYRTTRERVLQQLEKKASHRERNKTRGKMITEVGKFRSQEDRADAELKQLLGNETDKTNNIIHGSLPWRRTRKEAVLSPSDGTNGNLTDADDELLETLVKTATKTPVSRTTPRERKRTRNADRKSLIKRSRTRENVRSEAVIGD